MIQVKQQTYVFGEIGSEGEIESYSMVERVVLNQKKLV